MCVCVCVCVCVRVCVCIDVHRKKREQKLEALQVGLVDERVPPDTSSIRPHTLVCLIH
jgi:hypothetical protein